MAQYKAIKKEYPTCLLFFRLGEFYELFFEDAKIAASALDIVLTAREKNGPHPIPMCGVPVHASESYIARLIKQGHHVAICEQTEKATEKVGKGPMKREVVRVITTGTVMEEGLLDPKCHNFLMSIVEDVANKSISAASVDITTGDFFVESHGQEELSSLLTRMNPQEILLPEKLLERPEWRALWTDWKTRITPLPHSRFDAQNGEERLLKFFEVKTLRGFGTFSPAECAASGTVLDYILLTQKRHVLAISPPQKREPELFVHMDAFTRRSLEIVQTFSGEKEGTLLRLLDGTVTPMGARLFFLRVTHPVKSLPLLQDRLDSVEFFTKNPTKRQEVRSILEHIPDIERALSRLIFRKGAPKDMAAVCTTLEALPSMIPLLQGTPTELSCLVDVLMMPDSLGKVFQNALRKDLPPFLRDGGVIADGYNATLDEYRLLKNQEETIIQNLQKKYVEETNIPTLKIRHNSIIGHYIDVSAHASTKMPFHFILRQSLVSGSRYVTQELTELDQRIRHAEERTLALEEKLFEELILLLEKHYKILRDMIQALAVVDVSAALAEKAFVYGYVRPILDDSTRFHITNGRHPVVEMMQKNLQEKPFVPNDCSLDDHRVWILTGPNMAGKSTFLRQNALIVLLAHMGSFVPAGSASIGLVDRIFSRVGASDDLARGQSTFMVEMVETAAILHQATERSFVILDEVGRGTSTYDGLSLAWSCVEYLVHVRQCRTLFATHYHELTVLETLPTVGIYTLRIAEWGRDIVFLYNIIPGASQSSYGLYVAKMAGIPEAVLQRAHTLLHAFERGEKPITLRNFPTKKPTSPQKTSAQQTLFG